MAYPDRDAPWNKSYCYSRLNIKRFMSTERGYSIHQKVNVNYNMDKYTLSKIEFMYKFDRPMELWQNPLELIHWQVRARLHLLDRNHHSIEKDACEACKQRTDGEWDLFTTNLCLDCKVFKRRYQSRTGDESIEGWLAWSLSKETAYKKYIRKLGVKNGN